MITALCVASVAAFQDEDDYNYFYEQPKSHGFASILENHDFAGDYDTFDTFEGYIWHRWLHLDSKNRQFYLREQVQKEFGQLQNVSFDVDIVHIQGEK